MLGTSIQFYNSIYCYQIFCFIFFFQDIKGLQSRIIELERIIDEKDKIQNEKEKEFKQLKERIEHFETTLMSLQTDDSKIRSAFNRREKVALENVVTERVKLDIGENTQFKSRQKVSQVYQAHAIEYSEKSSEGSDSDNSRSSHISKSDVSPKETQMKIPPGKKKIEEVSAKVQKEADSVANDSEKQTVNERVSRYL